MTRFRAVLFFGPSGAALAIVAFFASRAPGALFDDFGLSRARTKVTT